MDFTLNKQLRSIFFSFENHYPEQVTLINIEKSDGSVESFNKYVWWLKYQIFTIYFSHNLLIS